MAKPAVLINSEVQKAPVISLSPGNDPLWMKPDLAFAPLNLAGAGMRRKVERREARYERGGETRIEVAG